MKALLLAAVALVACGPKPLPSVTPTLPGDGDAHTAKPPVAPPKKYVDDPWAGKPLLAAPAAKPPTAVDLPPIEQFKLSNGLAVFVVKNDRLPVVAMQLAIKAGRMHEPRARLGVSEMTADLLVKGTAKRDALSIAKAVDFVGGTLAAESTFEATLLSCASLAKDRGMCLDLLPDVVINPSFPVKELDIIRDKLAATVHQRTEDAGTMASLHVQNLLWGNDHVRGWVNSERSITAIHRDDIVTWHKTWFVPGNAMLVVTGAVDPKQLKSDLERAFGGWKKGPVPPAPSYAEPGLSGSRIRLVDKPGQTQTHIRVAQFGIKHDDPRFFDTLVWNYILGGGGFSSRLMKTVRVEGGKSYGASSSFDRNLDKGSFVVSTFTRNSEAIATTKLVLGEIAKMQKDGPIETEVAAAISNIAGGYGLRFQSAADVGSALIGAELHGFGREYLANFPLQIAKVTAAEARHAAAEILDPKAYVIVMVGDAKDLEPALKKEGWRYEKVSIAEPVTPELPEVAAPVDPKALVATHKLIDDALVAKGGRARLAALKAIKWAATGSTAISGQTVPVDIERVFVIPDKIRIDAILTVPGPNNTPVKVPVIVSVDNQKGWQIGPNQQTGKSMLVDIAPKDIPPIEFERWREPELILLKASDKAAVVAPIADETIDGKVQQGFKLQSPYQDLDVSVYIDKATKQIARIQYTDGKITNTDEFSDYKQVKGISVAHKRTQSAGGRVTTLQIGKYEIDPTIAPSVFVKPPNP